MSYTEHIQETFTISILSSNLLDLTDRKQCRLHGKMSFAHHKACFVTNAPHSFFFAILYFNFNCNEFEDLTQTFTANGW